MLPLFQMWEMITEMSSLHLNRVFETGKKAWGGAGEVASSSIRQARLQAAPISPARGCTQVWSPFWETNHEYPPTLGAGG